MVYINRQRGTISCVAHEELDHILSWMELHVPTLSDIHSKRPLLQLLSFLLHRLEWNSSDFMTALSCKDAFLVLHCGFGNSAVLFAHPHPQGGLFIAYQQGHCVGLFVLSHRQGSFTPWMWFMLSGVSLGRLLLGSLIPSLCFLRVQRRVTQLPELLFFLLDQLAYGLKGKAPSFFIARSRD